MENILYLVFAFALACSSAFGASITDDKLTLGKTGSSAAKVIQFGQGTGKPQIRYNLGTTQLEFTNDGTNYLGIGSGSGGGGAGGIELLTNPNFEVGYLNGFTNSGGTYAEANSTANATSILFDKKSAIFTATATGQYVRSTPVVIPIGLQGASCLARINYRGGSSALKLQVLDGTGTVLTSGGVTAEVVLQANAGPQAAPAEVGFRCPTSGSVSLQVISTAASAVIALDNFHLGSEDRFFRADQYGLVGAGRIPGTSGCTFTTSSGGYITPATAACPAPIIQSNPGPGTLTGADENGWKFTVLNLPEGTYEVEFQGYVYSSVAGGIMYSRVYDGINNSNSFYWLSPSSGGGVPPKFSATFTYTTLQPSITFQWQVAGANGFNMNNQDGDVSFVIRRVSSASKNLYVQTQAPSDLSFVNEFAAQIDGNGVVTAESVDFINGNCNYTSSNGNYACSFNTGVFTQIPTCTITAVRGDQVAVARINSLTTGAINWFTSTGSAALQAGSHITCVKSGVDYKIRSTVLASIPVNKRIAVLRHETAPSGASGNSAAGVWSPRILNVLQDPTAIVGNPAAFTGVGGTNTQFTLPAGTYYWNGACGQHPPVGSVRFKCRLQNITDGTTAVLGVNGYGAAQNGDDNDMFAPIQGVFTITAQKTFELQHRANATLNYGSPQQIDVNEVWLNFTLEKLDP